MKGYSETLEYLYGLEKFGIVFGLDSIARLLALLGNPHDAFRSIHIGGTNGKGSVATMVSAVLQRAGYRTGLYTSPHLVSFTERIVVDGRPIREEDVAALTVLIKEASDRDDADAAFTFFDFTTAMAFEYFRQQRVDVAVVEVGMGGKLDSTNVLTPVVCVITNVGYDHQEHLGTTIDAIAAEKAGIIKEGVPVVTGAAGTALDVIKTAASGKAPLFALGETFTFQKKGDQAMSYNGPGMTIDDLVIGLKGDHQLGNAAVALCALGQMRQAGFAISEETVRQSLSVLVWPGRLELLEAAPDRPPVLLDGAHNAGGAAALAAYLRDHFVDRKKILVFGAMKDKDFKEMLREIGPLVDHIIVTRPDTPRAASPSELAPFAAGASQAGTVSEAIDRAFGMAARLDLIVVTGSLYTVGEARSILDKAA
jgi:dihydrofolate synthase/folylpolyglutamate synthase